MQYCAIVCYRYALHHAQSCFVSAIATVAFLRRLVFGQDVYMAYPIKHVIFSYYEDVRLHLKTVYRGFRCVHANAQCVARST